jgi:hypothetical protein
MIKCRQDKASIVLDQVNLCYQDDKMATLKASIWLVLKLKPSFRNFYGHYHVHPVSYSMYGY